MMDAQETTFEKLLRLEDVWTGAGIAEYPSIPTFSYREALTIQAVPGQPRFFILQRTQKRISAGNGWNRIGAEHANLAELLDRVPPPLADNTYLHYAEHPDALEACLRTM